MTTEQTTTLVSHIHKAKISHTPAPRMKSSQERQASSRLSTSNSPRPTLTLMVPTRPRNSAVPSTSPVATTPLRASSLPSPGGDIILTYDSDTDTSESPNCITPNNNIYNNNSKGNSKYNEQQIEDDYDLSLSPSPVASPDFLLAANPSAVVASPSYLQKRTRGNRNTSSYFTSPDKKPFVTSINTNLIITVPEIQDTLNLLDLAVGLLTKADSEIALAAENTWSPPVFELKKGLDWTVTAWNMLTHPPTENLFPEKLSTTASSVFNPNLPEDIVIDCGVSSGEAILHAYVLHITRETSAYKDTKAIVGKLESSSDIIVAGNKFKT